MNTLFVIPARGGSKGIPGKNVKHLGSKPLLQYSLEVARELTSDDHICISTDDPFIIEVADTLGYRVPFIRPAELATDHAGTREVLLHALEHYALQGRNYEQVVFLQPTSPFRTAQQVREAMALYREDIDMVVSVKATKSNPYYILVEEDKEGWLNKSKPSSFVRRQDAPKVYELNGAIYVINVQSLKRDSPASFQRMRKYLMDEISSVDLDTYIDWIIAEAFLEKGLYKICKK